MGFSFGEDLFTYTSVRRLGDLTGIVGFWPKYFVMPEIAY